MPVTLRPATAADQRTIRAIVWTARINPLGLHWPGFVVAEDDGSIVGIGQIKPHDDDSRELASIAVRPARRRQGIAAMIIRALLQREAGPIYLMTVQELETFYAPFGFRLIDPRGLPQSLAWQYRTGARFKLAQSLLTRQSHRLIAMKFEQMPHAA